MSSNSLIAKAVILVSALVGGLVGVFELSDRFMVSGETGTRTVTQSGVGGAGAGQTVDKSLEANEVAVAAENAAKAAVAADPRSALERDLGGRVAENLARLSCSEIAVDRVTATARRVAEAETSHGFEGHTLDGAVVLAGSGGPERIRLAGSGKGPTGAEGAVDMAMRGFDEQFRQTEIFKENCRRD